jgi:phosphatidylserine/phosphatidylglycerophosphate/cardiolipin synthase-like enzyme
MNFGDLDVVGFGPVVRDVSQMFDRYWNDELAVPVTAVIDPPEDPKSELEQFRERVALAKEEVETTPYAEALTRNIDDVIALEGDDFTWAPWELAYDDPEKARTDELADAAGVESAIGALHTKGFVVDREELFVGSFNWDPRSAYINTELGIIIESPEIAGAAVDHAEPACQKSPTA